MEEFELTFYLGVDWGEKRIGLSLADNEVKIATPFKTVNNAKDVVNTAKEEGVDAIIIGHPIKMNGDKENLNPDFLAFMKQIEEMSDEFKIRLIDERLSSLAADKLPGNKKTKASRDEIAATLILQSYLDSKE